MEDEELARMLQAQFDAELESENSESADDSFDEEEGSSEDSDDENSDDNNEPDEQPPGLPANQIERLPTRTYVKARSSSSANNSDQLDKQCQVCLCDYKVREKIRILPCLHQYHSRCVDRWLSISGACPVCRKAVDFDSPKLNKK